MKVALAITVSAATLFAAGAAFAQAAPGAGVNPFQPQPKADKAPPPTTVAPPANLPPPPMMNPALQPMPMQPGGNISSIRKVGTVNGIEIYHTDQGYQFGGAISPETPQMPPQTP